MSGRGKGGKGLGAYHPKISEDDARTIFLSILPKKHHHVANHFAMTPRGIQFFVDKVMQGNGKEVKDDLAHYLEISPSKLRFLNVSKMSPVYINATRTFRENKLKQATKRKMSKVLSQIQQEVAYRPGKRKFEELQAQYNELYKKLRKK